MSQAPGRHIPELHRAVARARDHLASVGAPGQREQVAAGVVAEGGRIRATPGGIPVSGPFEQRDLATGGRIPEPDAVVPGGRGDPGTVGAEGGVVDEALMAAQHAVTLHRLRVPQPHVAVLGGRRQPCPIRAVAQAQTSPAWPWSTEISSPPAGSHSLMVPSSEAETRRAPSGLKRAWMTRLVCPRRTATGWPLAASQTRAV